MKFLRKIGLFFGVIFLASPLLKNEWQGLKAYTSGDSLSTTNMMYNTWFENSNITSTNIKNWTIYATENVDEGISTERTILPTVANDRRKINGYPSMEVVSKSVGSGNFYTYMAKKNEPKRVFIICTDKNR